ncbi:hypothetical protein C8Q70DRAFT_997204 [Cubamyces menziesii]|nr:hypothetical protein C8Q70DRAFT_997204 [Cubamyces menziesii]
MKSLLSPGILLLPLWSSLSSPANVFGFIASRIPARENPNTCIHLAVSPVCGLLSGNVSEVNAGVHLSRIKTIVAFKDSYPDGGRDDGGALAPPVVIPPDAADPRTAKYGSRTSRTILAQRSKTTLNGACTDLCLWLSAIKQIVDNWTYNDSEDIPESIE